MHTLIDAIESHIAELQQTLLKSYAHERVVELNALYELRNNLRYANDVPDVVNSSNAEVIESVVNTVIKQVGHGRVI